ncbi:MULTISPECIES: ankyrin repeat domain-containing protein [unclassified Novosphingobium]|uniref:ankyrin repeat domain-containing protein n=1 Tax=Novosphingobium TaxID=165696 RepID=UPI00146B84B1|nr:MULTISPECIES: ankyrin repeat domain-containing protein [unclassified Novosphingobium]NMN05983.1 ankyrin repeat protein [Novosphingobium sp. SG919]NMN88279.1 ankyrin repeat protein [Novosphingobium sp. SG916]
MRRKAAVTFKWANSRRIALAPYIAACIAAPAVAFLPAAPALAQFSESYKFLDAVRKKDGDKVNEALQNPASQIVNTKDVSTGETALHIVTQRRDLLWMQFLVGKGANVNARDNKGTTPLVIATNLAFLEGVDFLISVGARVDDPNNTGETPLITAVHGHNMALVRALLKAGANPDRPDNSGRSARDYAALDHSQSISDELESAAKKRQSGKAAQTYGPTF